MEAEAPEPNKGRILVVDDEAPVVTLLREWLADQGYLVHPAFGFQDVQAAMAQQPFDLVTLDIMMPEVDGLQVLAWIRSHDPDVGVIMATALGDSEKIIEAMRAGAINYLVKPFDLDLVTEQVQRGMERQRLIAENRVYQQELERKVAERTRELSRRVRELEGRDRLVQLQLSPPASAREADAEIGRIVAEVMEASRVVLYRPDVRGESLEATAAWGTPAPGRPAAPEDLDEMSPVPVLTGDDLVAQAFRVGQPRVDANGAVAFPVLYHTQPLGVLFLAGPADPNADAERDSLPSLGREIALAWRILQMADDLAAGQAEMTHLLQQDIEPEPDPAEWQE